MKFLSVNNIVIPVGRNADQKTVGIDWQEAEAR